MSALYDKLLNGSGVASVIISIALMLLAGFALTRITKLLKLPNVTGYITAGILIGPFVLNLIPETIIKGTEFIPDIALAFIAFSTGEFFKLSDLKKNGLSVTVITLAESLVASAAVFVAAYLVLGLSLPFSIILAALSAATAPASTVMTIRQTGAKGDFVNTLLQTVALDDVVGLIAFSVAISVSESLSSGSFVPRKVILPLLANLGILVLGGVFGLLMKLLMPKKRSTDNRLIISVALLFSFCGICALIDVSPLLGCMSMGMVYINITGDDKLFKQLNYFSPPLLLLFFVRSGITFKLDALTDTSAAVGAVPLIIVGAVYFAVRIFGKYFGAFFGCMFVKKPKKTRNYLGLALIPQAGVAIGLAALGARELGGAQGEALQTVVLAACVLYELIGPACAKFALYRSGAYSNNLEEITNVNPLNENGEQKTQVEILTERLKQIQSELPAHEEEKESEEEKAFLQAAEEQYAAYLSVRRNNFLRHNRRDRK